VKLLITSHERASQQETLEHLPEIYADPAEIWVQESQAERYRLYLDDIRVLPVHITTLGATRQYLVELYRGKKIVLMDDDLTFYWRENPDDWHLTVPPEWAMVQMFNEVDEALDKYAHVGLSGREGQNRLTGYSSECTRYMRFTALNTAMMPGHIRYDRINGLSDFDMTLQLLRAGLPSLVFHRWAQGHQQTQARGGLAAGIRTHDRHASEIRQLCELHPGLVRPRKKANVSGGEFGTREEMTVEWKMALDWDRRMGSRGVASPLAEAMQEIVDLRFQVHMLEQTVAKQSERLADMHQVLQGVHDRRQRVVSLEEFTHARDKHT
jgi:TET-associated glycosyltransferase-like protein